MEIIDIRLWGHAYQAGIEAGLLSLRIELPDFYRRCAVITDRNVARLYGARVRRALSRKGLKVETFAIPPGERSKTLGTIEALARRLLRAGMERGDIIAALGGGVVGDIAGFLAATYMRGVDYVQIPTTLVAQVDSSIGGKTGVNLREGKNLLGSFHQPVAVLTDPKVLRTLPTRHFNNGMAEVIKTAAIGNARLFRFIEDNASKIRSLRPDVLAHIIAECCRLKARIVGKDERESGIRAMLNFGHTVGHALEAAGGYIGDPEQGRGGGILHGEAVSIGMVAAAKMARHVGAASGKTAERLIALLREFGLPTSLRPAKRLDVNMLVRAMKADKKVRAGEFTFILPRRTGAVSIVPEVPTRLVRRVLNEMRKA